MMNRMDHSLVPQSLKRESCKGRKTQIIPGYITKYLYRQGEGNYPDLGYTVQAYYVCSLISGKQLIKRRQNRRFLLGRKRLIRGLQIGLLRCRKNEKFRLVIAPQYGYGQSQHLEIIPKNSTLIYEFDIIDIYKVPMEEKVEVQKYLQLHHIYNKVDRDIERKNYQKAIMRLAFCYTVLEDLKGYKNKLRVIVISKWAHILIHLERYEEAFKVNQLIQKNDNNEENYFFTYLKLKRSLGELEDARSVMDKFNDHYGHIKQKKRVYVQYLKDIKEWRTLRQLSGYDFANDKIFEVPQARYGRGLFSMGFRPFLSFGY